MAKKTGPRNGSQPTRERYPRLDAAALAKAIEVQRQELSHVLAIVHSNGELLHEAYRFERGESDSAYCCDVVCTMLRRVISALRPLIRLRLEAHDFRQQNDAGLGVVFASINQTLDRILTALEPLCLGLPIPHFDGRSDEAARRH